jgi:hypothetical protein
VGSLGERLRTGLDLRQRDQTHVVARENGEEAQSQEHAGKTECADRRRQSARFASRGTISGDGVSPAARAAASGLPPGSAAATAFTDAGRPSWIAFETPQDDALDRRIQNREGASTD